MKAKSMKLTALLAATFVGAVALWAGAQGREKERPDASPGASVMQVIGTDSKVTVNYHRPAVKDRKIWRGLVDYGKVWRAGANETTTISFSDGVTINGKKLAAGTYGFHIIPQEEEGKWTLIFNKVHQSWGSMSYDEGEDALRVEADVTNAPNQERLAYGFEELTPTGGATGTTAFMRWEKKKVSFRIELDD